MMKSYYRLLGEQFLDFLVYTVPLMTVIRVMGTHWHKDTKYADTLKAAKIKRYFKGQIKIVDIEDTRLPDVESAVKAIREEVL